MALTLARLHKIKADIAEGKIDLRDTGTALFGKFDQDEPAELIELAISALSGDEPFAGVA